MEATKRTYQKKSNKGKITVKHYLNTKLKPVFNEKSSIDGKDRYPVYVRMIVLGKVFDIKSKILYPIGLDEFQSISYNERDFFDKEISRITKIINTHRPFANVHFNLKDIGYSYNELTTPLNGAIENTLIKKIQNTLISIGKESREEQKKTFKGIDKNLQKPINFTLNEILDWKGCKSLQLINFLSANSISNCILGFDIFQILKEEYYFLWDFEDFYNEIIEECTMFEPTPIDWFEGDYIKNIILKTEPIDGKNIVDMIDKLLSPNPNNKT